MSEMPHLIVGITCGVQNIFDRKTTWFKVTLFVYLKAGSTSCDEPHVTPMLLFYSGWHYAAVVWFSVQKQSQRNNRSSLQHYSGASVVKEANVESVKGL